MTIAEASRRTGLTTDTLRYYERVGIIPPVPRTRSGIRDYDEAALTWIELMKCMRSAGMQIEALVEYNDLYQQGDATLAARKDLLVEQRKELVRRLEEMQSTLARLDQKIASYEQSVLAKEREARRLREERDKASASG